MTTTEAYYEAQAKNTPPCIEDQSCLHGILVMAAEEVGIRLKGAFLSVDKLKANRMQILRK